MLHKFFIFSVLAILSCLILAGCHHSLSSEPVNAEVDKEQNFQEVKYKVVASTSWVIEGETNDQLLEARLERATAELDTTTKKVSLSKLVIKNTSTNTILLEQKADYFPNSISKIDSQLNDKHLLLVKWGTASRYRLEVYTVTQNEVTKVLDQGFKGFYMVYPKDNEIDILTVDTSLTDDNRLIVEREVWNGEKFKSGGKMSYEVFASTLDKNFK